MALPTGPAVVFLFTDIEGSTRCERSVGSVAWASIVARHDSLLREAIEGCGGTVVKTEGDAFFAAFDDPVAALRAAAQAQHAVAGEAWPGGLTIRVRMGLHLGEGRLRSARPGEPEDYVGIDVNYAARIAAAGNGRQIVVSAPLVAAIPDDFTAIPGFGPVELIDAGARTVKDFDEPAHLFRLVVPGVADDDRALRTTDAPTNLPGEVTELVGREADIAVLREALAESRIVTLTGPGGSGKTRLALGLARDVRDRFPHGTWFIDLAAVREASLIESAIASAIDVRESPEIGLADALRAFLRDRSALLVLDNLEQLLPDGAEIVARLVRSAPDVRLIITSRELLRIAGERGYPVPPLDVDAGVRLFVDRARSHRSDLVLSDDAFVAVRAIAERLGGLPLAIELAAARVRVMSPAMILERLGQTLDLGGGARDMPERQRTLRGAIAWSHDLLSPTEQRLFARLGVFAGGCTTEAAYAVADPDGDLGLDVAVGLESLADKSLVRIELPGEASANTAAALDETRFSLHPLLREYALERLGELGEGAAIEARFAAVYATIAESAGPAILSQTGEATIHRLDRDDRNMRAAIDWSIANDQPDFGLRILGSIWRWFQQRGRLREGRGLLATLLGQIPTGDPRVRLTALSAAGGLAYWMNDFAGAGSAYEERLALAMTIDDPLLMADAHYDLGFLGVANKDAATLREHEQIALDLYTAAGRDDGVARARQALVLALFLTGDYEGAHELELQNFEAFKRDASHLQVADSMTLLAAIAFRLGDPATSWQRTVAGLRVFVSVDSASGLARGLGMAAILLLTSGDLELGARATGATYRLVREKGVMLAPVAVLHLPDPAILSVEKLGAERSEELMAAGAAVAVEDMLAEIFATAFVPAVPARD